MFQSLLGYGVGVVTAAVMVAATLDPNLVLNIATIAGVLGVAFAIFRSGGFGVVRQANEELRRYKSEAEVQIRNQDQQIALLEMKTSLEPMVAAVVAQFESHEERAAERHEASMSVFAGFAATLERIAKTTP